MQIIIFLSVHSTAFVWLSLSLLSSYHPSRLLERRNKQGIIVKGEKQVEKRAEPLGSRRRSPTYFSLPFLSPKHVFLVCQDQSFRKNYTHKYLVVLQRERECEEDIAYVIIPAKNLRLRYRYPSFHLNICKPEPSLLPQPNQPV